MKNQLEEKRITLDERLGLIREGINTYYDQAIISGSSGLVCAATTLLFQEYREKYICGVGGIMFLGISALNIYEAIKNERRLKQFEELEKKVENK